MLWNRRALALTIAVSVVALILAPDLFAAPFSTLFGFNGYFFHTAQSSVLVTLCSLEGEKGWGLPVPVGRAVYFLLLPVLVYVVLSLVMGLLRAPRKMVREDHAE